ncbi:MAG: GNAT family N-acetyltransferase [Gemmataceae bacterium]
MHLDCGPCAVRSWRADDLDALLRHADNPKVADNLRDRFPHPYTRQAGEGWLKVALTMRPETAFVIEHAGELVGGIGVQLNQDVERVSAEVGYWLGEAVWGCGLATAALVAFSRFAFDEFALTRLYALPFARNAGSRRVLEKAGYHLVGILRNSVIKHGEVLDQALYDLVR